ncbi:heterokaryon incompatibility protein-domain-containing protein [Xylaria arbuscula]|nr:heterokaryon incompatibility protein-domain-containing protein [Xylaria arbuscula]
MRLIHIPTMVIHEYQGEGIPPYAILSHTWGREEVSFSDFQEGKGQGLAGYKKIRGCCEQAKSDGLDAVWIDTCCIDKRSSAELSEAINSMFKWYQKAAICYAYLDDVITEDESTPIPSLPTSFPTSRWFRRGWTLQELLAPSVVIFYSVNWVNIGNRNGLASIIAETTKIDPRFFDSGKFEDFSIAQRMSWASRRQTTRIEDEAYCLLGLFGVNMPLLYGEGEQAFVRLQQEIMKESDDQTIFAWGISDFIADSGLEQDFQGGVLAPSPKSFVGSGHIVRSRTAEIHRPYVATNKGLQISLPLISAEKGTSILIPSRRMRGKDAWIPRLTLTTASGGYIAVLNCQPTRDSGKRIGFYVEQNTESKSYVRVNYRNGMAMVSIEEAQEKATHTDMLIQLQNKVSRNFAIEIEKADRPVLIRSFKNLLSEFELVRTVPKSVWQHQPTGALLSTFLDFSSATDKKTCALEYTNAYGQGFVLLVQKSISLASVTGLEACLVDKATMANCGVDAAAYVQDAISTFRSHGPTIIQTSSHGLLNIVVTITEARHASIVNLEAQRVTSSIRPKEGPSKLVVPPLSFSTFPDITFTPAEAV